jgi:endonuclease/exonuclease/phosphatase family metal-dependent hydrolase
MKLKILNLNLWNYNSWEERKPKIVEFIKEHDPDVVVLQEVRDDLQFNEKGDNQAEQLNKELKYPHLLFYPVTDKRKERPEKYKVECTEGTAVLSKFAFTKTEEKMLKKEKEDRYWCGNLYFQIDAEKPVDFVAVHFSPNEIFSMLHLKETLKYIEDKNIKPIIIGDFNIIKSENLHELISEDYVSSMQYKKYLSYPPGNFTLDYIVIPKEFEFDSLDCVGTDISDHKALVAEAEI